MILIFIGCIAAAGAIGFVTATLFKVGADHRGEPTHREPTILWTVGNLCMWKGKLCKIERFDTTANNQTVVHLSREGLNYGLCVPVEELEAVEE